jgi:hypothetical protein
VSSVTIERLPSGRFRARAKFHGAIVGAGTHDDRDEALGVGWAVIEILEERGLPVDRRAVPSSAGVYAIACGKFVKVGSAGNVRERMRKLQTANPLPLRFLRLLSTDTSDEASWLERLRPFRVRGEWFTLCDGLLAALEGAPS